MVWSERKTHLQEARDVPLVTDAHGHYILEEPEERAGIALLGPGLMQQAVEFEEQTTGPLCEEKITVERVAETLSPFWISSCAKVAYSSTQIEITYGFKCA